MGVFQGFCAKAGDAAVAQSGVLELMSRPDGLDQIVSRLRGKIRLASDGVTVVDMDGKAVGQIVVQQVPESVDPETAGEQFAHAVEDSKDLTSMMMTGLCYIKDAELIRLLSC